ncbi:hypothetical protein EV401DRAFT_2001705 [Pisolithus croceorrhizus]|nr:hypothetical protein EV401DRAFT_2001705 [Pisolithus croceorrhizus]
MQPWAPGTVSAAVDHRDFLWFLLALLLRAFASLFCEYLEHNNEKCGYGSDGVLLSIMPDSARSFKAVGLASHGY